MLRRKRPSFLTRAGKRFETSNYISFFKSSSNFLPLLPWTLSLRGVSCFAEMLQNIFVCLSEGDVILPEAFYKWEASNEGEGKGVATTSVTQFLVSLRENEDDDEDDDDDAADDE